MSRNTMNSPKPASLELGRFNDVDATGRGDDYIAMLDLVERLPAALAWRERSYQLLDVAPGQAVVDVGCGTGGAVAELAARGAQAIGIDSSKWMIDAARRRFPQRDFRLGSAGSLPFEDGSVYGYRAERLYQHLPDPVAALAEARRVLAPDGRIVLLDQDYAMWVIDSDDVQTTCTILDAYTRTHTSPWIGRRHRALLLDAGFDDVVVEVNPSIVTDYASMEPFLPSVVAPSVNSGVLTQAEADTWLAEQARRGETNRFLRVFSTFLSSARRP